MSQFARVTIQGRLRRVDEEPERAQADRRLRGEAARTRAVFVARPGVEIYLLEPSHRGLRARAARALRDRLPSGPGAGTSRWRRARFAPRSIASRRICAARGRADIAPDLLAGVAIAALAVPQAVAYALVAGLPAEMGLAAAALPALIASLFGSSRFMVTGPTNPTALLLGVSVVAPAVARGEDPIAAVLATGLVAGAILIGLGLARLRARVALPVRLRDLGLQRRRGSADRAALPADARGRRARAARELVARAERLVGDRRRRARARRRRIRARSPRASPCPVLMLAARRVGPRFPAALVALGARGAGARRCSAGPTGDDALPAHAGDRARSARRFTRRAAFDPGEILPPALALALLVTVQAMASARALEPAHGPALDPDRELFSQGVANLTAALVGAQCTSGSLTRSLTSRLAGAHTRLASVTAGALVALFLPVLAPGARARAARGARRADRADRLHVDLADADPPRRRDAGRRGRARRHARRHALARSGSGGVRGAACSRSRCSCGAPAACRWSSSRRAAQRRLREVPIDARTGTTPAVILHLEGDLNFAVAPELADRLKEISARGPEVLILRLKRARHLDATVLEVLRRLAADLARARRDARAVRPLRAAAWPARAHGARRGGRSRGAPADGRAAVRRRSSARSISRASACARGPSARSSASSPDDDWQYEI